MLWTHRPRRRALAAAAARHIAIDCLEERRLLSTVMVDDDRVQCPDAQFTSIQAAVVFAQPGDTIEVCPGVYNETVNVPKTLTLLGARAGQDARPRCDTPPDPMKDSIVQPPGSVSSAGVFNLAADNIVLDGFTVQNNSTGPGIYTVPLDSGYQIRNNIVQHNVFGLYFNASGTTQSVARHDCFKDNNRPGAASGNGIYSDQGLHNALITENLFTLHTNASIVLALNQSDITITRNASINDAGIALFDTDNVTVGENLILNSDGSGIFLGGLVTDAEVSRNVVTHAAGSGIASANILPEFGVPGGPNANIHISQNYVTDNGRDGISLEATTASTVEYNVVLRNGRLEAGDGIRLGMGAVGNTVRGNQSESNRRDGIRAETGSADNQILGNHMRRNGEHDCHDDTVGPGTAGTANFWVGNEGYSENRPGLCRPGRGQGNGGGGSD